MLVLLLLVGRVVDMDAHHAWVVSAALSYLALVLEGSKPHGPGEASPLALASLFLAPPSTETAAALHVDAFLASSVGASISL